MKGSAHDHYKVLPLILLGEDAEVMKTYQLSQPRRKMRIWDAGATMDPPPQQQVSEMPVRSGLAGPKLEAIRAHKEPLGFHDAGKPLRHSAPHVLSGQTSCWEQTLHLLPKPQRPLIKMQASKQSRPRSPAIITPRENDGSQTPLLVQVYQT